MVRFFDWSSITQRGAVAASATAFLSPVGRFLALDAVTLMLDRWRWEPMPDNDWDTAEAEIAEALQALMTNSMVGMIFPFVRDTLPDGALMCDGDTYLRAEYPELYDALPAALHVDADNFMTPTIVGRFVLASGGAWDLYTEGGAAEHTLTETEMPAHSHTYTPPVPNVDLESPGAPDLIAAGVGLQTTTGSAGGGEPHNNMPPYVVLPYAIWAR